MTTKCMRNYAKFPAYSRHPCTGGAGCTGQCAPRHPDPNDEMIGRKVMVLYGPLAEHWGVVQSIDRQPAPVFAVRLSSGCVETFAADMLAI